jgi:hypothetical protein
MDDMKLVEALNDLRSELKEDNQVLRREVREDMREVRKHALKVHAGLTRYLIWAVIVLGLALGSKDLLEVFLR